MNWKPPVDLNLPAVPPVTSDPSSRSAELLEAIAAQFDVEHAERYRARDVTGDGISETFCNFAARDLCNALGAPLPAGLRANELEAWLQEAGPSQGWVPAKPLEAQLAADAGKAVVVTWRNQPGRPGHIAVLMPSHDAPGLFIYQAGVKNFARAPLFWGFGNVAPLRFFVHP